MGRSDPLAARDEPPPATYESGGFAARRLQRWVLGRSDATADQPRPVEPLATSTGGERLRAFRDDACTAWPQPPPTWSSKSGTEPETVSHAAGSGG